MVHSIPVRASEGTPLIKQDIVHQVIERTGLPRTKAEAAVDTVFEGLKEALAAGERIELRPARNCTRSNPPASLRNQRRSYWSLQDACRIGAVGPEFARRQCGEDHTRFVH